MSVAGGRLVVGAGRAGTRLHLGPDLVRGCPALPRPARRPVPSWRYLDLIAASDALRAALDGTPCTRAAEPDPQVNAQLLPYSAGHAAGQSPPSGTTSAVTLLALKALHLSATAIRTHRPPGVEPVWTTPRANISPI